MYDWMGVSKAALESASRYLARYLGPDHIRSNIVSAGPLETIAKKAIPDCNLCFVSGAEIQSAIEPYYNVLFTANPASIGGAMPGSDFYYVSAASSNG